ncbi:MAG: META domain-containing protein [Bacteroidales bacterium]|nr:META domain-containing protein [Bacteroidales bacterium]
MKKIVLFVASAVAALSMVSCAESPEVAGDWKVVKIGGESVEFMEDAPFLSFDAAQGRVHGNTGVNIINGSYTIDGHKLHLIGIGTTMMAGPEQDMLVEQKFLSAINDVTTVKGSGNDKILLYGKDGNLLMELVRK